jgi:hypothetical protein
LTVFSIRSGYGTAVILDDRLYQGQTDTVLSFFASYKPVKNDRQQIIRYSFSVVGDGYDRIPIDVFYG